MAVPRGDLEDNSSVSDKTDRAVDSVNNDLSANTWDTMRSEAKTYKSGEDKSSVPTGELVFDNGIYGTVESQNNCPATPKDNGSLDHLDDLKGYADKNFDRIDSNHDGSMSDKELQEALNDPCLKGEDRKAIEILTKHADGLEDMSDDEFGPENDGITKADLNEFGRIAAVHKEAEDIYGLVKDNMSKMDTNGDKQLDKQEIEAAIAAAPENSQEKALLEKMRNNFDQLQSVSNDEWGPENDGITIDDVLSNAASEAAGWDETGFLMDVSSDLMRHWLNKQADRYHNESLRPKF